MLWNILQDSSYRPFINNLYASLQILNKWRLFQDFPTKNIFHICTFWSSFRLSLYERKKLYLIFFIKLYNFLKSYYIQLTKYNLHVLLGTMEHAAYFYTMEHVVNYLRLLNSIISILNGNFEYCSLFYSIKPFEICLPCIIHSHYIDHMVLFFWKFALVNIMY